MAESLTVVLDAETAKLDAKLKSTDGKLKDLDGTAKKTDKSMLSLSKAGDIAGQAISGVAAAGTLAAAALSAAAVSASSYARELKTASEISKESTGRMQELSFATRTVGIDMDTLANISKDSLEKVGDYLNTGGGGFQDFVDAMNSTSKGLILTADDAKDLANEFKYLSGTEVLQEMVKRMEGADVASANMSHALEGMASDTTNLIPLLADSGKQLKTLTDEFNSLGIKLSDLEIKKLEDVGEAINRLSSTTSGVTNKTIAALDTEISGIADLLTSQVSLIGEIVIKAVTGYQYMVAAATSSVMNLFREAEIAALEASIAIQDTFGADATGVLADIDTAVNDFVTNATNGLIDLGEVEFLQTAAEDIDGLKAKLIELKDADAAAESFDAEYFSELMDRAIEKVEQFKSSLKPEEEEKEKEDPLNRAFDIDQESIEEHLAMHAEYLDARRELYFADFEEAGQELFNSEVARQQELLSQKLINEEEYLKRVNSIAIKYGKSQQKNDKQTGAVQEETLESGLQTAISVNNSLFENNKGLEAGLVVAKTGTAVMHQLESGDPYTAFPRAAAAGVIGAAQLASVLSASNSGGGSVSTPSSSAPTASAQTEVTGEVEINESIGSGGQTSSTSNTVTITAEDGDELAEAFASVMNKKLNSGEITLG